MQVKEFIDKAKRLIRKNNIYSIGQFNDEFKIEYLIDDIKIVSSAQEVERHRWYSVATDVYMLEDGFVGIKGIYQLFSEQMSYSDTDYIPDVILYEAFPTIAYRRKTIS